MKNEFDRITDEIIEAYRLTSGLECRFVPEKDQPGVRDNTWHFIRDDGEITGWAVPVFSEGKSMGSLVCDRRGDEPSCRRLARLLYDICRVRLSDENGEEEHDPENSMELFDENEAPLDAFTQGRSLSEYVYDDDFSASGLKIFWKTVETKAGGIFINMLADRFEEARVIFNEIMTLAYCESDIMMVRVSAETLFHIIILTRFARASFDSRYYRITFDTMTRLFTAETADEAAAVMNDAFDGICRICKSGEAVSRQHPAVRNAMRYLEENYSRDVKISEVAEYVHMSPEYLSRLFRKETSYTVKWFLTNVRMRRAQELLINSAMPIKDIGRAVGYTELRSFYKAFSKHFGMKCSEFRSEALIK